MDVIENARIINR